VGELFFGYLEKEDLEEPFEDFLEDLMETLGRLNKNLLGYWGIFLKDLA
jgi:hypothetical protein